MDRSGVKTVVIVLLLIVNIAAAAAFGYRGISRVRAEKELLSEAERYIRSCGVALADGVLNAETRSYEILTYARDPEAENAFAQALSGSSERASLGSGTARYTGVRGTVTLTEGCGVSAVIADCGLRPKSAGDARRRLVRLLASAGLELSEAKSECHEEADGWEILLRNYLAGVAVANETLSAHLDRSGALTLTGRWRIGGRAESSELANLSQAAAVARFVGSEAHELAEISEAETLYYLYEEVNGATSVLPVFRLRTGERNLVLDPITASPLE